MPQYLSPGVYVEEIPSAVQAIVGVSTSTAGFIGRSPNEKVVIPPGPVSRVEDETSAVPAAATPSFNLAAYPVVTREKTFRVWESTTAASGIVTKVKEITNDATLKNDFGNVKSKVVLKTPTTSAVTVSYDAFAKAVRGEAVGTLTNNTIVGQRFQLASYPVKSGTFYQGTTPLGTAAKITNDFRQRKTFVDVTAMATEPALAIMADYLAVPPGEVVHKEKIGIGDKSTKRFPLANYPVDTTPGMFAIRVGDYQTAVTESSTAVTIENNDITNTVWVTFTAAPALNQEIWADYIVQPTFSPLTNEVKLCTSFSEYRKYFGDFSADPDLNTLTHAVYGFFHNGGSRCYVAVMKQDTDIDKILEKFAAVDEIALVAAPGITDGAIRDKIVTHCKIATQDRFAIFDSPEGLAEDDLTLLSPSNPDRVLPGNSDYAAFYFPWIQVFDPTEKTMRPKGDGRIYVPPSGHMAGIYARVDNTRGVHKAPANEIVLGALGLKYKISKAQQDGLNPQGVNCIRDLNSNIRVWGARTIGGDANGEWRYINVRRTMLYLRESIDEGVQWAVFEPNDMSLWAKITLNVSAFLTIQWRAGMLFGSTAQEAFYVKCDAETNPPELREIGQVVTEIGVAIVRPAEFVIFRISQWQPQKGS